MTWENHRDMFAPSASLPTRNFVLAFEQSSSAVRRKMGCWPRVTDDTSISQQLL
jgi:hypothetical protein